jgi:phosphoribosylamine--glycine ligase
MRVLIVGGGGREHALVTRIGREVGFDHVFCAPGNPGIAGLVDVFAVDLNKPGDVLALAAAHQIDLTVVGPELPLSLGIADRFAADRRLLFGPTQAAAQLESSKAFAKAFMARHHVPTARFRTCESAADALDAIRDGDFGLPVVLKADGLAAGKGVVIAQNQHEAEVAITAAMTDGRFGAAGRRIVIEECLSGPEVSFFVISDGVQSLPIGSAQDHKRIFDDDQGPNTGGMGAFAPSPLIDRALHERVMSTIVNPVVSGMAAEGRPFRGFLYVGLMLTADGPKVIEFNVRLGDPEAQVILPLIDEPLVPMLAAGARGDLQRTSCRLAADKLVAVVLASGGYPASSSSGQRITGIATAERETGASVLHAGTALKDGDVVTAGGRVLTVVGRGSTFADAIEQAYQGVERISFAGMQYRRDIGRRAVTQ